MAKSGYIGNIQYNLFGGALGSEWHILGTLVPSVPVNTSYALAVNYHNTGDEVWDGNIAAILAKPDGTLVTLIASSGQNAEVAIGGDNAVIFAPVTLDQYGAYTLQVVLTENGQTTIFDTNDYIVADTGVAPSGGLDINNIMSMMVMMGIVGMMAKVMASSFNK